MKAAHSDPKDLSKTKSRTDPAGNTHGQAKGDNPTVILRTPVPKYGHFTSAKKKPKEGITTSETGNVREVAVNLSHLNQPSGRITGSTAPIIVGKKTNEALRAKSYDQTPHKTNLKENLQTSMQGTSTRGNTVQVKSSSNEHSGKKQVMHVAPQQSANNQVQGEKTLSQNMGKFVSVIDPLQNQQSEPSSQLVSGAAGVDQTKACGLHKSDSFTSNTNIFLEQWTKSASEAMCLKEENKTLKNQLEVQLQVNKELKRLLVASVGEDLCQRVENLIRDKAELSAELGDFAKKMSEDYENLDKVSIQADMWRSKYIASRLMIDELAKNKAFYGMQYQESQRVLQEMLTERHELRTNLSESYRCLQHVRDAFDPLNTHKSSNLQFGNVIDLAKTIQNLAETIRFRLLPAGSGFRNNAYNKDMQIWPDALTKGESSAQELLSRKVDISSEVSSSVSAPNQFKIDRYHPQAAFDNLTLNCCGECKGEIKLL